MPRSGRTQKLSDEKDTHRRAFIYSTRLTDHPTPLTAPKAVAKSQQTPPPVSHLKLEVELAVKGGKGAEARGKGGGTGSFLPFSALHQRRTPPLPFSAQHTHPIRTLLRLNRIQVGIDQVLHNLV